MMNNLFNRRLDYRMARVGLPTLIAGASILFVASCASIPPPNEQIAVSTAAVANAAGAGGAELAPVEMKTAREKLDRAKLAMTAQDYDRAQSLAEEAQVDAQLAGTKARSIKAQKAADELQESSRVLREELNRKSK
ncbi:MAG TPA: DUF4398 domain-containing protein [Burkholderiales bacterium]|nr:DUF4398 domain-containing protein [Burkholderiales bacterium]